MGSTTRVIRIERHGPPEVLTDRTVPLRDPAPNEVVVHVHATGVNFADLLMRAGLYGTVPRRPYSPGFEVAGEVTQVGRAVEGWAAGDRVVTLMRYGGYAHDVVVPAERLFRYPATMTPDQAAAIPVAFLTAWVGLFEVGSARRGATVLVLGAAGGVGTAAVQLAVRDGLRVVGTAGTERKRTFVVETLGAAACFDSRSDWEPDVVQLVGPRGIDLALDPIGGVATRRCLRLLSPLGRLVFYGLSDAMPKGKRGWISVARAWLRTPRLHPLSLIEPNIGVFGVHLLHLGRRQTILRPALTELLAAVGRGELRAVVDRTFPLDRNGAIAAHRHLHSRTNLGKVVLVTESAGAVATG